MKMCEFRLRFQFVPNGTISNIPAFVQITAWRQLGGKPLSEQMIVNLLPQICVIRLQWVKISRKGVMNAIQEIVYLNKWLAAIW